MNELDCLRILVAGWFGVSSTGQVTFNGPSGGGGLPITPPTGTPVFKAKIAGETEVIPVGAFDIGIIILTGTGTQNGVDLPAGIPQNFANKTATAITVVLGSPGTARISYMT